MTVYKFLICGLIWVLFLTDAEIFNTIPFTLLFIVNFFTSFYVIKEVYETIRKEFKKEDEKETNQTNMSEM